MSEGVVGVGEGVGGWNQSSLLLLLGEGRVVLSVSFGWPWAWGWVWVWVWVWETTGVGGKEPGLEKVLDVEDGLGRVVAAAGGDGDGGRVVVRRGERCK